MNHGLLRCCDVGETSTQRVSTTPSRRGHWRPGRPSWEYQLTSGKGRIRRSFLTLTVALSRQDQISSVRDSLTLLRWAVTGSARARCDG